MDKLELCIKSLKKAGAQALSESPGSGVRRVHAQSTHGQVPVAPLVSCSLNPDHVPHITFAPNGCLVKLL